MPKENRIGDGSGLKDASLASHSPECESPHHAKGPGPPPQIPLQAIIKTEMDIDSCCGPSPCGSHHSHDSNIMVGPTDSPSVCYSSSPSYSMHQEASSCVPPPYSRIHVSCSSHSPTTSNSMSPHPPPSPHHPPPPLHLHNITQKGGVPPGANANMHSPMYVGSGDKDLPHPHKYASYGPAEHNVPHSSPHHHHPHIRNLPSSESCNYSGIMVRLFNAKQQAETESNSSYTFSFAEQYNIRSWDLV